VGSYSRSHVMPQGAQGTSVSCFTFTHSALATTEPEREETAHAQGHQQAWLCDLGTSWSKPGLIQTVLPVLLLPCESCSPARDAPRNEEAPSPGVLASLTASAWSTAELSNSGCFIAQ